MQQIAYAPPNRKAQLRGLKAECAEFDRQSRSKIDKLECLLDFYPKIVLQMIKLKKLVENSYGGEVDTGMYMAEFETLEKNFMIVRGKRNPQDYPNVFRFIELMQEADRVCSSIIAMFWEMRQTAKKLSGKGFDDVLLLMDLALPDGETIMDSIESKLGHIRNNCIEPSLVELRVLINASGSKKDIRKMKRAGSNLMEELAVLSFIDDMFQAQGKVIIGLETLYPKCFKEGEIPKIFSRKVEKLEDGETICNDARELVARVVAFMRSYDANINTSVLQAMKWSIAAKNAQALPRAELRGKVPHSANPLAEDIRKEKEAQERQLKEKLVLAGATSAEISELAQTDALQCLDFVTFEDALSYYRKKKTEGKALAHIMHRIGVIDGFRAECADIVSNMLFSSGFNASGAETTATFCINMLAAKIPRMVHPSTIGDAFKQMNGQDIESVLFEVAEDSPDVYANLERYYSAFLELTNPLVTGSAQAQPARHTLELPQSIVAEAENSGVNPRYVRAVLSSFRSEGTVFNGKAHLPDDWLCKRARWHVTSAGHEWKNSEYKKAWNFLSNIGIVEIYSISSPRLVTSGSRVQNPLARAILPCIREFYRTGATNGNGNNENSPQ